MKKILINILFLTFIVSSSSCSEDKSPPDWNDAELKWFTYKDGIEELKSTNNNGILIIYADWCPTCREYSRLFKNPDVVKGLEGITLIRSNKDLEPELSKNFSLDGEYVPRTFALDRDGNIIESLNSNNPKWWHFLPSDDPEYLIKFSNSVKIYEPTGT